MPTGLKVRVRVPRRVEARTSKSVRGREEALGPGYLSEKLAVRGRLSQREALTRSGEARGSSVRAEALALAECWSAADHQIEDGLDAGQLVPDGSTPPGSGVLAGTVIADPGRVHTDSDTGSDRPRHVIALGHHNQVGNTEDLTCPDA